MSEFERENEEVFHIVRANPRRRGVIRDVGYIINQEQAQRFAAYEAAHKRRGGMGFKYIALMCLVAFAVICITIAGLI